MNRNRKDEIKRIIEVREAIMMERGLSKTDYAEKLGYDLKAYNQIERRGAIANYLISLHSAFGISADYILHNIKSPF